MKCIVTLIIVILHAYAKVHLWWTLFEPFFLNIILTLVTENIMFMVAYFRGCGCVFHPGTF